MNSLIFFGAFSLLVVTTSALKCYTCKGTDSLVSDDDCGDTYEKRDDHLMMCNATAGEVWCRKEKTGANGVLTSVTRGCTDQCEERNDAHVRRVTCCNTDGCNSAGMLSLSFSGLITSIFLQFL